jgi:hypothetical protein
MRLANDDPTTVTAEGNYWVKSDPVFSIHSLFRAFFAYFSQKIGHHQR